MRTLIARIRIDGHIEEISIEDRPRADGLLTRKRYEKEPDGFVAIYRDHIRCRADGTEELVDTFRPARFSPDKLLSIEIRED